MFPQSFPNLHITPARSNMPKSRNYVYGSVTKHGKNALPMWKPSELRSISDNQQLEKQHTEYQHYLKKLGVVFTVKDGQMIKKTKEKN